MNKLEQFFTERQSSKGTRSHYNFAVQAYEKLLGLDLDTLIEEAYIEEDSGIAWRNRKIRQYLIDFRNYLYSTKSEGTANRYFADIKTIYRHFEVELHTLPTFNSKQIDKTYEKSFEDILTKQELKDAYYEANNVCKCLILFGSSTGMSKVDMLNLTVEDFLKACNCDDKDLKQQLEDLKDKTIIPCFEGERIKTGSRFTTFCSPEATEHIVQYLLGRYVQIPVDYNEMMARIKRTRTPQQRRILEEKLKSMPQKLECSHKLFDISESHLNYTFRKINNKLQLGTVGKYTKFRCHQLRSYQASTLLNIEEGFTDSEVDALQGRKKDKTHRAYLVESKSKLYNKYHACVDELMLFKSINEIDTEAFEKLEKENNFYKKEIVKNELKLEEQQKTITEIISNQRELEKMLGL